MKVTVSGHSPDHVVVGSAFALAGLPRQFRDYTTAHSGLLRTVDLGTDQRQSVLEWSNLHHQGERLGLHGFVWQAPVTVMADRDQPQASFSVWAEDDAPRSKYLIESGKVNVYVTYEMPPFDDNRDAESVAWRVNAFAGGWTAAATPFADSVKRRGYADGRASWRNDISMFIFAPGVSESWLNAYKATFPPEVRHRVLIWLPQSWRALHNTRDPVTHDAYYWDNTFSEQTVADIRRATEAGFRVSGYTNPHYHWGSVEQVIDPEIREIVRGNRDKHYACPVLQKPMQVAAGGTSLANQPYREHMLRTYEQIYGHLDMSIYTDTMHQVPLCGRGRALHGMSSYEATIAFYRAMRELKANQLIGTENLTELTVMAGGADYGLFFDLGWAAGWERQKAVSTHPILGYLYRETSIQVPHSVNLHGPPQPRYYHLNEEISERIGTVASVQWVAWQHTSPEGRLDTPEKRHWFAKIQLYVRRGLRPCFPEDWEDGVMSYLRAADGTVFKFLETEYGSKLVEFPRRGKPVIHLARAWKTSRAPAAAGHVPGWLGVADNGDSIGLDNPARNGYPLLAKPDGAAERLRLNALPDNLAIIRSELGADIAVIELGPADRELANTGVRAAIEGTAGKTPIPIEGRIGVVVDRPLHRVVAAYPDANLTLTSRGAADGKHRYELTGNFWGDVALIWREGVYAPFEPTDDFLVSVETPPAAEPGEYFVILQTLDPRWNASLEGPRNPRPGTVYQIDGLAVTADGQRGNLALFLCDRAKSMGLFRDTFQASLDGSEPSAVTFGGVRRPDMPPHPANALALRSFPVGEKNVRLTRLDPIRFIRPTLRIDRIDPIDLGQVAKGAATVSALREIANSQTAAATAGGKTFPTVLYGAARITAPVAKRPDIQTNDYTGVILTGKDAKLFRLQGEHPAPGGGLLLVGADGQPGLAGGAEPEKEAFAVAFLGAPEPGDYTATVRIVTQAGNLGVCSAGKEGEPLAGLYYVDIAVNARVD